MADNILHISWENFHFLRPLFLWLLLPAFAVLLIGLSGLSEQVKWKKFIAPHLRPYVIQKGSEGKMKWMQSGLFIFLSIAIVGAAGPTWKKIEVPGKTLETPLVIALDLSQSMMATDIQPNRLGRAKFKITDLLVANPRARVALVGFAGTAHTIVPLTSDYKIIKSHLDGLSPQMMPYPGTNLEAALVLVDTIIRVTTAPATLLLITDDFTDEIFNLLQRFVNQGKTKVEIMPMNTVTGANVPSPGSNKLMRNKQGNIVHSALDNSILDKLSSIEKIHVNTLTLDKSDMELLAKSISSNLEFKEKDEEKANQVPTCQIIAPANGEEITKGETVTISVDATDSDGTIAEVRFYIDGVGKGSQVAEDDQVSSRAEVLISVSSTVADSSGIDLSSSRLSFAVDEGTGETVINIVDNKSGEVIKQIPSDDILKLKKKMVEIRLI